MELKCPSQITTESGSVSPCRTAYTSSQSHVHAPQVSANAWSIINIETGECLWSKNKDTIRDIASLTKMMTFFVVKQGIRQKIFNENDLVSVPFEATLLGGTSAYLKAGDILRVIDLLYAMMLPSGNDAAFTLAYFCGGKMLKDLKVNKKKLATGQVEFFVKQMNQWCRSLGLKHSKFLNPHGLSHLGNQSTAYEISKLASILIKRPLVKHVVGQHKYACEVRNGERVRTMVWNNTNLLLGRTGVTGFKTGQTPTAGPCLCVTYCINGYKLALTLLKTRTPDQRWTEASKLIEWAVYQLDLMFAKLSEKDIKRRNLALLINSFE